ncbi:MAG: VOC family protein [Bacteroidota bacterium]|nr:VOC family protein [Bacteroidota bacterium]
MKTINPYLSFNGKCEEAFNFYKSVFGGKFLVVKRFKEMPENPNCPISASEKEKIMHISLPISKETVLFGCDSLQAFEDTTVLGDNISLSIDTDSTDEATRIFNELSSGGNVTMPMEKTFWNAYYGMVTDKFGISWMVNYDLSEAKN